jgi:hypothetical protein
MIQNVYAKILSGGIKMRAWVIGKAPPALHYLKFFTGFISRL